MVMGYVKRRVSFIIAEKSMHRPIIGPTAKLMGAVPVVRPQDLAKAGPGMITHADSSTCTIHGRDTQFKTAFAQKGSMLLVKGTEPFRIAEVVSDTEIKYIPSQGNEEKSDPDVVNKLAASNGVKYYVIPKVDQSGIFGTVHDALCKGNVIGIFPEGGSSDRADLLPLKAGVTIMALGAADRGAPVKIIPYGINYFAGHVFRSPVLIDIGAPISIDPELVTMYHDGQKREACDRLLKQIEAGLRSVTFNAPDYETMKVMRTMRRLFQGKVKLPFKQYMELNRRFVSAYVDLKAKEPALEAIYNEVKDYLDDCDANNLSDKEVQKLPPLGNCTVFTRALFDLILTVLSLLILQPLVVPMGLIDSLVLLRITWVVQKEMDKALAGSNVKVRGRDVAASQKIITAAVWFPVIWFLTAIALGIAFYFCVSTLPNPYPAGSSIDFFLKNLFWIGPLIFIVIALPYSMLTVLVTERNYKNVKLIPKYILMMHSLFAKSSSPAVVLRTTRKTLAIKVQDLFHERIIPQIPRWAGDPIIDRKQILDYRRKSDVELGIKLQQLQISTGGAFSTVTPTSNEQIVVDKSALRKSIHGSIPNLDQVTEEAITPSPRDPEQP